MTTNTADAREQHRTDTDSDVAFEPPATPYHRADCLRLVLPGVESPADRLDTVLRAPLLQICNDVTYERNVERLELLSFPTAGAQEYLLHATSSTIGVSGTAPDQHTLDEYGNVLQAPVLHELEAAAKHRLPDRIGLEWAALDFEPLGLSPVPTCRLVVEGGRHLTPSAKLRYRPFARTLAALEQAGQPHLYQLLVTDKNGGYRVSVRLAIYGPAHNVVSDEQFAYHVSHGHEWDLARMYEPTNLTSNFRISVSGFWRINDPETYNKPERLLQFPYYQKDHVSLPRNVGYAIPTGYSGIDVEASPDEVRDLVVGTPEHERLLQGTDDHPDLYKELCGYPWFDVNGTQLGYFAELAPVYHETNPWTRIPSRNAPALTTDTIVRTAPGTTQHEPTGTGTGTDTAIHDRAAAPGAVGPVDPVVSTQGSTDHQDWVATVARLFREHGDDIDPVEQTTESLPDLWLYPTAGTIVMLEYDTDSDRVHVEVELTNESKPGKLLANAARAIWQDREVIFVFETDAAARTGIDRLREPFRETTAAETLLYNGPVVTLPDGASPAIPGEHATSRWWLSPDGDLRLTAAINPDVAADYGIEFESADHSAGPPALSTGPRTATGTLAAGPATDSTATYDYACPRYVEQDGRVVIETRTGAPLAEYPTADACAAEWSRVYAPHVPLDISYLESAIIMYQTDDALAVVEPAAEWDVDGHTDRYEGAVEQFAATYTVEQDGGKLPKDAFRERALRWYRRQTNRKAPNNTHFGRAAPEWEEKRSDDRADEWYEDRTWRYPRDLVSPDLPGVGSDAGIESADDGREGE